MNAARTSSLIRRATRAVRSHKPLPSLSRRNFRALPSRVLRKPSRVSRIPLFTSNTRHFASITVSVPNMGDSITEGVLVEWTRGVGDFCNVDDIVAVIETDKVSVDIRAEQAGVITELKAEVDDTIEVGAALFSMDTSAEAPAGGAASPPPPTSAPTEAAPAAAPTTTTSAPPPPPPPSTPSPQPAAAPVSSSVTIPGLREERRVPMSRMRQRIAQRLKDSQNTAASLTTFNEIDMQALFDMRNKHKDEFVEKHGVKLGFMSAFVKASCAALKAQPAVNAYMEGKEFVYHDYCDVSVAVASPTGLVVPVIRNAESMSFMEVEKTIQDFAKQAKNGTLTLEQMAGGTFTISNGGVFGSLMGTPILNPPQSAILGMHGVFERPVAIKGQMEIRPMMYVALTYDHRIIDGREAVLFLRTIKNCIEDPQRLLLDL